MDDRFPLPAPFSGQSIAAPLCYHRRVPRAGRMRAWNGVGLMKKAQEKKIRTALTERQEHLEGELSRLQEEIRELGVDQGQESGGLGNHMADDGSNVAEQERILTISNDIQDMLNEVGRAEERLDAGTYGDCERCGKEINPDRLEAFPWVSTCIECQSIIEREQNIPVGA